MQVFPTDVSRSIYPEGHTNTQGNGISGGYVNAIQGAVM